MTPTCLTSSVQSLEADLKEEVYIPIERWHTRYREVKVNAVRELLKPALLTNQPCFPTVITYDCSTISCE